METITNDKPVKIKNLKRVEQGKKLAAISKAAKERKRQERHEVEEAALVSEGGGYWPLFGFVGMVVVGFGSLYLYRQKGQESEIKIVETKANTNTLTNAKVMESFD